MPFSNQRCQFYGRSLLLLILCHSTALFSQKEIPSINSESFELPVKKTDGFGLSGFRLTAENPVEQVLIDSVHGIAYVVVNKGTAEKPKSNGYIIACDYQNGKVKWSRTIDFNRGGIFLADTILIYNDGLTCVSINRMDGSELWRKGFYVHTLTPTGNCAIASGDKNANDIRKVDILTGKETWFFNTGAIGDLEKATFYGDSLLLIASKGLYYVPLDDGKGWYQKAKTGLNSQASAQINTGLVAGAVVAGALMGALGAGIFIAVPISTGAIVGNRQDNYLIHENHIYVTATDKLHKYNENGELILEIDIPFKSVDVPKIFMHDNAIFASTKGKAINSDKMAIYSPAFIAKLDPGAYTWEKIHEISKEKRDFVNDYILSDSSIVFACANRMLELRLSDLEIIQEKTFGTQLTDIGLKDIVSPPGFIPTETGYLKTTEAMPGHIFIENSAKMKIEFDKDLAMAAVIAKKNYFSIIAEHNGMRIIGNGSKYDLIDSTNHSISDFEFSEKARFYGNMILDIQGTEVMWVSLPAIYEN